MFSESGTLHHNSEKEQEVSLRHILTHDNSNIENYQQIISNERERNSGNGKRLLTDYGHGWEEIVFDGLVKERNDSLSEKHKLALEYFKKKLGNDVLIDLGCGDDKNMDALARRVGSLLYIGVDSVTEKPLNPYIGHRITTRFSTLPNTNVTQSLNVHADMLDFVARLPDNYANFAVNGIDEYILLNEDYREAFRRELARSTKKGGIIFGYGGPTLVMPRNNTEFKLVTSMLDLEEKGNSITYKVLEKTN